MSVNMQTFKDPNYTAVNKHQPERLFLADVTNIINSRDCCSSSMIDQKDKPAQQTGNQIVSRTPLDSAISCESEKDQSGILPSRSSAVADSVDDSDLSRSRRKPRTVFSRNQLNKMKEAFNCKPYLTTEERKALAVELKVTSEQVKVWFQNHRSKLKRQGRLVTTTTTCLNSNKQMLEPSSNINSFNPGMNFAQMPYNFNSLSNNGYVKSMYNYPSHVTSDYYSTQQYGGNDGFYTLPIYPSVPNNNSGIDPCNPYMYASNNISAYIKPDYNNADPNLYNNKGGYKVSK